jgi:hypothetical protein
MVAGVEEFFDRVSSGEDTLREFTFHLTSP